MGFLQISSTQPTPNSDEKRELDATFLSTRIHVNVEADSGDDIKELPTPVEGKSKRQVEKRVAEPIHFEGKKKKGDSLDQMTKAILGFIEMRKARLNRSTDCTPQSGESFVGGGDRFSIDKAVTLLNKHTDVDHFTYCKVVKELHNPESNVAFFAITIERRRAWIDFVGSGLQ